MYKRYGNQYARYDGGKGHEESAKNDAACLFGGRILVYIGFIAAFIAILDKF